MPLNRSPLDMIFLDVIHLSVFLLIWTPQYKSINIIPGDISPLDKKSLYRNLNGDIPLNMSPLNTNTLNKCMPSI